MQLLKILTIGQYLPDDLVISVSKSNRKIDPEIENQLELIWQRKKKEADELGKICYNGLSYRLNSFKKIDKKLAIDFGIIEYKTRDGLKEVPAYFNLSDEYHQKGCYVMATVKTVDHFYLMVELSGKSMNPNEIDLLGGILETNIELKTGTDVFQSLFAELEEEASITKLDIQKSYLRSVILTINTNVCLYFEVSLGITINELQNRFKDNKDQDIKSLKSFSKDEYINALKKHRSQNKQLIPTIINI